MILYNNNITKLYYFDYEPSESGCSIIFLVEISSDTFDIVRSRPFVNNKVAQSLIITIP